MAFFTNNTVRPGKAADEIDQRPGFQTTNYRINAVRSIPKGGSPVDSKGTITGWTVDDKPPMEGKVLIGVLAPGEYPIRALWAWPETPEEFVAWAWSSDRVTYAANRAEKLYHEEVTQAKKKLDRAIDQWFLDVFGPLKPNTTFELARMDAQTAALTLWRVVRDAARQQGQDPAWETFCTTPEDTLKHGRDYGRCWRVCWEAGIPEWGVFSTIYNSMVIGGHVVKMLGSKDWFGEPYYSFDVRFVED